MELNKWPILLFRIFFLFLYFFFFIIFIQCVGSHFSTLHRTQNILFPQELLYFVHYCRKYASLTFTNLHEALWDVFILQIRKWSDLSLKCLLILSRWGSSVPTSFIFSLFWSPIMSAFHLLHYKLYKTNSPPHLCALSVLNKQSRMIENNYFPHRLRKNLWFWPSCQAHVKY